MPSTNTNRAPSIARATAVRSPPVTSAADTVLAILTADCLPVLLAADGENRERLRSLAHKRKSIALWRLYAFRCPDCRLDTVWDHDTDEWWTLDHTDYSDAGSSQP